MTRDEMIQLAHEAGFLIVPIDTAGKLTVLAQYPTVENPLILFAELVAARERRARSQGGASHE